VGSNFSKGTKSSISAGIAQRLNTVGKYHFLCRLAQKTLQRWVEETPETFRFTGCAPSAIWKA
jgi:hypothetical protein